MSGRMGGLWADHFASKCLILKSSGRMGGSDPSNLI